MSNNLDLALSLLANGNILAQVAYSAIDLDAIMKELFESGDVEDLVGSGLRGIDDELSSEVDVRLENHNRGPWARVQLHPDGLESMTCEYSPSW